MARRGYNEDLPALPDSVEVLRAVHGLTEEGRLATARQVAWRLGVLPARRLGTRASKGNWSGTMNASARIAPRLGALARRGLIHAYWDPDDYRYWYELTVAGREALHG